MTIAPVTSTSTGTPNAAGATAQQTLSSNYNMFLQLLTAQLRNQDPMSPMDSSQFTQQLVEYSQVEQQITTNDNLSSLISLTKSAAGSNAVNYLGHTALTQGGTTSLAGGAADWSYSMPGGAANVTMSIADADGNTVFSTAGDTSSGAHDFVWDGKNANGVVQPDGAYTLSVAATASDGTALAPTVNGTGIVEEIDMSGATPTAVVGGRQVNLTDIVGLKN